MLLLPALNTPRLERRSLFAPVIAGVCAALLVGVWQISVKPLGVLAGTGADIARQQLGMAVRSGAATPDLLARPLLRWQREQRAAALVALPLAEAPEPPAPDEGSLRRFHENNPERFSTPEYREAAVAVLTAELISREVEVAEADIAAAFDARRGQFETPERRVLDTLVDSGVARSRAEAVSLWLQRAPAA